MSTGLNATTGNPLPIRTGFVPDATAGNPIHLFSFGNPDSKIDALRTEILQMLQTIQSTVEQIQTEIKELQWLRDELLCHPIVGTDVRQAFDNWQNNANK